MILEDANAGPNYATPSILYTSVPDTVRLSAYYKYHLVYLFHKVETQV